MEKWKCRECGYVHENKDESIRDGLPNGSMLARIDMIDAEEALDQVPFEDLPSSWSCPKCQTLKEGFEAIKEEEVSNSEKWICDPCGYIYDPDKGDFEGDIPPGTLFGDLPDEWVCPLCGAPKADFSKVGD